MGPKPSQPQTAELFRPRLDEQINMRHPLVRLAALIDWAEIERTFAASFTSVRGRPALPPRLVAGLLYLQHAFDASDEAVVNTWVENPYWQFLCGETYLQTEAPIDPSSLTRWRKRVGEEGVQTLLAASIEAARRGGVVRASSVDSVIVDTTVMPKAIAHPPDRQPAAGQEPTAPGEGGPAARPAIAPELQPRGSSTGRADRALRSRQAVQASPERSRP
ncbi:hypothetical protein AVHM3334_21035 [Acidovorax sp. SUPP3334]|nr:hypothetical protein AVHM3334_21035 [Acidovorax sp. SUPP3334]